MKTDISKNHERIGTLEVDSTVHDEELKTLKVEAALIKSKVTSLNNQQQTALQKTLKFMDYQ